MKFIYVIKSEVNEYGERHIDKVVRDEVIHHKSGIFVTKSNGFVKDKDAMLTYTAQQLYKLLMENAWNGHFSRELNDQYRLQAKLEQSYAMKLVK